jgi:hypothetical protein
MDSTAQLTAPTSSHSFFVRPSVSATCDEAQTRQARLADHQFIGMLDAYRRSGGLARLQELANLGGNGTSVDLAKLATCISRRELICFEWQSYAWLPLFQFDLNDMSLRPQLQPIVIQLSCVYNPWEVAFWFTEPKPWLSDRAPADTGTADLAMLLQHARSDRLMGD